MSVDQLLEQARDLSADERVELAARLLDDSRHPEPGAAEEDVSLADTINRRIAEVESGEVKTIPAAESIAMLRAKYGRSSS